MFYCDDSHHVAEELKKRVEPVSMWRLTEELELTEEKGTKLFAVLRKHEDKKKRRREKRKMLFRKLKSMSEKEETTVEPIRKAIKALEENDKELRDVKQEGCNEFKKILSLKKQPNYIIFQEPFRREIRGLSHSP